MHASASASTVSSACSSCRPLGMSPLAKPRIRSARDGSPAFALEEADEEEEEEEELLVEVLLAWP
eukprot:CAMPEP_0197849532 /NCGR_PEP_ID=MMETSP1438-20131217/12481_1 /TAXON_ID=1461541 /ORGANISM="Pterosperma sp., Strain CCMP1384" /LENGTH=64 /DNA_ID=CAMNT_0043462271 /DNA_START=167 /DNA_END=361 /DNA_ORIENTATION=-